MVRPDSELGISQNPHFLSGRKAGENCVIDPILPAIASQEIGIPFSPEAQEFLDGFIEGLTRNMQEHKAHLPVGSHLRGLKSRIELAGFIDGYYRRQPNIPEVISYENVDGLIQHALSEGYYIGFYVSVLNNEGVIQNPHEIPSNEVDFKLFMKGVFGEELTQAATLPKLDGFIDEREQRIAVYLTRLKYIGGLRLWLHSQGLDVKLAENLTNPITLRGFKLALSGENTDQKEFEPAEKIGFELGTKAKTTPQDI